MVAPNPARAAKLKFASSSIEWLVLSGASQAALKGAGTLNRKGGYEFLVSMIDGGAAGDKIRVKIVKQVGACPQCQPSRRPPVHCRHVHLRCKCSLCPGPTPNHPQPAGYWGYGL
jgi:hypothetical protein